MDELILTEKKLHGKMVLVQLGVLLNITYLKIYNYDPIFCLI